MNLFSCCKQVESGSGYQVTTRNDNKKPVVSFHKTLNEISKDALSSPKTSIIKITKSDYATIAKEYSKKDKKWTDFSFPPNDQSLGVLQNVTSNKWARISQIVENPVIFSEPVQLQSAVQASHPNKAYFATLAALAERLERVQSIFGDQVYNPNGFYKVLLRVKDQIQEILIDDYVPIDEDGNPLFAKPHQNQIWTVLVEKARAKVHGSYEKLIESNETPKEVFEQVDFAPTQRHSVPQATNQSESLKLWRQILDNSARNRPIIAKSGSQEVIDWTVLGLVPNHYYSLIGSVVLKNNSGKEERILKLRNSAGQTEWKGTGNQGDNVFWEQIDETEEKARFLSGHANKDGVFLILWTDFQKYFKDVFINLFEPNASYINEDLFFNLKNGLVYQMEVFTEGFYTISVDQEMESKEDGWARTSLLIIKKFTDNGGNQFEFVDGTINVDEPTALLKSHLMPGKYVIYSKTRPTAEKKHFPKDSHLIVYSENKVKLSPSTQEANKDILKKTFLAYGRSHKRQLFHDDLLWMSWKLFNQGGYGFVAFGNDKDSNEKFVISFNEEDFTSQGFTLKKPFKGKGNNQTFEVLPGEQQIILLSVGNSRKQSRKFPPKLGVNIHPHVLEESIPVLEAPSFR